jgi:O-antigen/teichoic acid export membrane protein
VGRIQLFLITLVFTGFVIFGQQFLKLWVEPQFKNTYYVLLCLILTNLVTLTQRIADDYIYVENRIKDSSIRLFLSSLVGLIISALLAPKMGAIGCGIGTGAGLIIYTISINYYYNNMLKLNMKEFFRNCHLKIMPLLLGPSVVAYCLISHIELSSWFYLLTAIFIYFIVFGCLSYFFLFNKDEKMMFYNMIPHRV